MVENHGVQPDIVVENRPDQVVKGQDPQLEKAIEVVMKEIQANPKKLPPRPPDLPAYPRARGCSRMQRGGTPAQRVFGFVPHPATVLAGTTGPTWFLEDG